MPFAVRKERKVFCKKNMLSKKSYQCGLLFMMILFLCCSCSGKKREDTDTLNYQYEYSHSSAGNIAKKDGYYYTNCNGLMQVSSQEDLNFVPLCANPDCKHDSDSCSARKIWGGCPVFAYNEGLYILASEYDERTDISSDKLMEMSLDNFTYATVATIGENAEEGGRFPDAFLHRGSLYYIDESIESDHLTVKAYKLNLQGNKKPEVLLEVSAAYCGMKMFAYEDKVYFLVMSCEMEEAEEAVEEEDWNQIYGAAESSIYSYQTDEGKLEQITLPKDIFVNQFCADEKFLYYIDVKTLKTHKLNLREGTDSVLFSIEDRGLVSELMCNEKYLFVWHCVDPFGSSDAPYTVEVYDRTGFLVEEIELPPIPREYIVGYMPMGADEKYMILYSRVEDIIWVYDMEQMGAEEGKWEAVPLVSIEEG